MGFSLLSGSGFKQISTQDGLKLLSSDKVASAKIVDSEQRIDLTLKAAGAEGKQVQFYYASARGTEVVNAVTKSSAKFDDQVDKGNWFSSALWLILPFLAVGLIFWFLLSSMQGGGSKVMQFGKSKAKLVSKETPKVTFADVAGADEAIEELEEIKDFLKEPAKFQAVGARIPKGVLLYGPPGTGKTLLGPRGCRRGERSLLLHLRFGLRRDVRGRRREPRARPLRAGQGELARDHLRG